jgi:ribosomal protein S18 acetylase RimI-like enzyme
MITLREQIPMVADYQNLRKAVGWYSAGDEPTSRGLQNSLYSVCAFDEERIVGCGRIIGDAGIYYYIQDIIVHPDYQGRGIGRMIMDSIMAFLRENAQENCFIGLMAAKGVIGFHEKYGFTVRPSDRPGMFIVWKA